MNTPLDDLLAQLARDGKPSLSWVTEHAPDGDLQRLWDACGDDVTMTDLLRRAGRPRPGTRFCDTCGSSVSHITDRAWCADCAAAVRRAVPVPPRLSDLIGGSCG